MFGKELLWKYLDLGRVELVNNLGYHTMNFLVHTAYLIFLI
jgi:hypothetical protein